MAVRKDADTPCYLKVNDIFPPAQRGDKRLACRAIYLQAATGVKYFGELGLEDEKRTQRIHSFAENICARLIEQGKCPAPQT